MDRADVRADPGGQHRRSTSSRCRSSASSWPWRRLYESWSLPLAVILVVPMCLLCSVSGVLYTGRDVNIFVQIGLVVLVGLACKNAILIVEYAKQKHLEGLSRHEATLEACRLRLRPILMTSFAFIIGVIPLVVASGAGSEMRRSLGIAVFSGMVGVTLFGIFLTPVFFSVIMGSAKRGCSRPPPRAGSARPCERAGGLDRLLGHGAWRVRLPGSHGLRRRSRCIVAGDLGIRRHLRGVLGFARGFVFLGVPLSESATLSRLLRQATFSTSSPETRCTYGGEHKS